MRRYRKGSLALERLRSVAVTPATGMLAVGLCHLGRGPASQPSVVAGERANGNAATEQRRNAS